MHSVVAHVVGSHGGARRDATWDATRDANGVNRAQTREVQHL